MRSRGSQNRLSGNSFGSRVSALIFTMIATMATIYVAGRLWQDAQSRVYLIQQLEKRTSQGHSAVSVDDTLKIITCREQQKKLSALEMELSAARKEGFVPKQLSANNGKQSTKKILSVIGVMTTFGRKKNRDAIRKAWMPSGASIKNLAEQKGIIVRFVIGRSANRGDSLDKEIEKENSQTNDFIILDDQVEAVEENAKKTKSFFIYAVDNWDAEFYAKVNDDVYVNLDALGGVLTSPLHKSSSSPKMDPIPTYPEISIDVPPYLRVHKNGTIERLAGIHVIPPGIDPQTKVISKDITIIPKTGLTARLYSPNNFTSKKLPLIIYFHGGAYCISSASDPLYHNSLNKLVLEANTMAISVNYRLAPEHPLPTAYDDSWEALQWIASHTIENHEENHENLIKERVDFNKVFLAGDSAGANIGHYMSLKLNVLNHLNFKVLGLIMVNPYFWGKEPIGVEISDYERRKMVDKWWEFVCPSDKGNDDPLINPFVEEAPNLEEVGVEKVLITVCEKDILRERGKLYHKKLVNSGWKGTAEFYETQEEDHVFHIFNPDCDKAKNLIKRIADFINE